MSDFDLERAERDVRLFREVMDRLDPADPQFRREFERLRPVDPVELEYVPDEDA